MTFFKGPAEQRADERRVKDIGPPANPAWWTPVRVEVMRALMRRSEIHVRMASMTPGREKTPRWRPHAIFMKTKHLFEGSSGGILTPQNVGPAIRNLIEWGFLRKAPTAVAQVEFTIKGWAWLAAEGHIEPAWLELIFEKQDADRAKAWELCRKIKGSRKLHNLSTQFAGGLQEKVVADIMEPSPMTENMPFVEPPTEDELPGLPQFDDEVEGILRERAHDGDEVQRRRMQLARDFHHKTGGALTKLEPKELFDAIGRHFSSEEIVRADLEMIRAVGKPGETYFSRELVNRMSEAQEFKPRSLADHLDAAPAKLDGLPRGADRIAFAVEAQELRDAGLARHMPGSTTLGDVHDRLRAESVTEMGQDHETSIPDANTIMDNGKPYRRDEAIADVISHGEVWREALTHMRDNAAPATVDTDDVGYWQHQLTVLDRILLAFDIASEPTPLTPENIAKANKEWKAEDDKLPMVDWIDRRLGQYDYDGWVPKGNAALVAREAVFRHMRENPVGARVVMSEDQPFVQYDGFRLHVRQQDYTTFEGRPCQFIMSVDSDYDPQDTENIKAWFGEFIAFGAGGMRGELVKRDDSLRPQRNYHYPQNARVDHEVVGELEAIKVRSINPLWMVGMMFGSSFLALIMFLVFLNFLPGQS
ncbi:hypothetical protein FANBOY_00640 [Brevundimonas phage vB_BgoS-Fanboy]|nr:hypothetical protein FANBOY_00640 [Brevundimonas phage vB_BgoS-Fanboy]